MDYSYTKRPKGGYYAHTPIGLVIVHRRYEFTLPTRDWVARSPTGRVVIDSTRKGAVDAVLRHSTDSRTK